MMRRAGLARRALARFRASRAANVVTLAALTAPVVIAAAAFAVDEGSLYVERREAQGMTDLAAIAAAADIDDAEAVARTTLAENGLMAPQSSSDTPSLKATPGHYTADPALPREKRFVAGQRPYNAVHVAFAKTGRRYFSKTFFPAPRISTEAIARRRAAATFSIGSRLARLDGGLLNAILGGLTGSELSLKLMDYEALASTDIDLLEFFPALATDLDLDAATYSELLDTTLTLPQLAGALAKTTGLSSGAKHALEALAGATRSRNAPSFKLARLAGLEALGQMPLGAQVPGLGAQVDLLQIVTAAAALAGGEQQIDLDLGADVPGGLLDTSLTLAIGEPPQKTPWLTIGSGGEIVRTAQTRLRLVVAISAPGNLLGVSVRLPLYLDLAYAEAKLKDISCSTGRPDSIKVKIDARPGVADLRIADMDADRLDDFRSPIPLQPAQLVSLPLIKVTGAAHAEIGNETFKMLTFDADDIAARKVRRVSTTSISRSLIGSLLGDLDLHVEIIGLDLGLSSLVKGTLQTALQAATPAVDDLLVTLLSALGVTIGEADVRVHGATCGRPVLVQ